MSFWSECEIERPAEPVHFSGLSVFFSVIGIFSVLGGGCHLELDIFIVSLVIDPCFIKIDSEGIQPTLLFLFGLLELYSP